MPLLKTSGGIEERIAPPCRIPTRQEAMREITKYIEIFYNRQQRQKKLEYLSPAAYEKQFVQERFAA